MPITINQSMLDTITGDSDDTWDEDDSITFSIGVDPGNIIQEIGEFFGFNFDPNVVSWDGASTNAMIEIAELWDDVIAKDITYIANNDEKDIIVNMVDNLPAGTGGITYSTLHFPFPDDSDVYLVNMTITSGQGTWRAAVHEFGHALGLMHPGSYDASDEQAPTPDYAEDTAQFSIMSYFGPQNFGTGWTPTNTWSRGEMLTPMIYDILAIQRYYGADTTSRLGDTVYGFNSTADRSVYSFSAGQKPVLTIWDAGGDRDRLDVSGFTGAPAQMIDLHEGSYSDIAGYHFNVGIAFGTWIEEAISGGGADTLIGNHLNNYLDGGGGIDTMRGELGDDTYLADAGGDVVVELLDEGNDTINTLAASYALSDNVERLIYVGNPATGFTGTGNALNNEIRGATGAANVLDGKGGDDTMVGGSQNDLYVVDTYGDKTVEAPNGGNDTVRTALGNYTLQDNVENLEFTGAGPLVTVGNDLDNMISGGAGNDVIAGAGGNDTLTGNNGHDTLSGDNGEDKLFGGAGNDLLDGGADNDVVEGGSGDDQTSGGTGNDTVRGGANNDYVDGGDGNDQVSGDEGNDQVSGGAGTDTVWGGSGNDQADGGAGNDIVYGETGDDQANGGDGDDFVSGGANNDYVDGGIGNDTVAGDEGNDQVSGGDGVDLVSGGSGNDQVDGGAGNDVVAGGSGNDQADGGDGDDTVSGDEGDDSVTGGIGNDVVAGGSGNDQADGGAGDDTVSGDEGDDIVTGAAGMDFLSGGDGNDSISGGTESDDITGGAGNDTISGGDGNDTIHEGGGSDNIDGGAGFDTVDYSASTVGIVFSPLAQGLYGDALGDQLLNIEKLIGTNYADVLYLDTADNQIFGLGGNDKLYGLAGNDFLDGGTGADLMTGSTGDDIYIVDNVGDSVVELNYHGLDRIETSLNSYLLGLYVEDLTFIGAGNFTGTGNSLNNTIIGGAGIDILKGESGDDTLNGLGGVDTMYGGLGNDTYYVDNSNDKTIENKFDGTDIVFSTATYTIAAHVENLTLLDAGGNINGTGNYLANAIVGNSGANQIDGGLGVDNLTGGGGADAFIFSTDLSVPNNVDRIIDFSEIDDTIWLENAVFKAFTIAGALAASAFNTGSAASDATDRIIYDSATGALYYDSNGSSSGKSIQFATLAAGLSLTAADFLIV